jgi:hypothetical protein
MSSYDDLEVRDTAPIDDVYLLGSKPGPVFRQLVQRIHRQFAEVDRRLERAREAFKATDDRLDDLERWTSRIRPVDELPANAPAGMLIVTAGDPNVYVGTGPNTPLRRIPTLPLA